MATDLSRVTNVEDEIFWKEVRTAVAKVERNHRVKLELERGTHKATVHWSELANGNVHIRLYEVEPKQPALLVP